MSRSAQILKCVALVANFGIGMFGILIGLIGVLSKLTDGPPEESRQIGFAFLLLGIFLLLNAIFLLRIKRCRIPYFGVWTGLYVCGVACLAYGESGIDFLMASLVLPAILAFIAYVVVARVSRT